MTDRFTQGIDWLGHASFRLRGSVIIYIDPWKLAGEPHDADIVLITHSHYDHLSAEDIAKVSRPGTVIVGARSIAGDLPPGETVLLAPGEKTEVGGVEIEAVRAYNTNKKFHPKENDWVGYIINLDGLFIYHCGDTDVIDEMNTVNCDVALLTVSGTYVMTADEAVEAARRIGPKVAIPMHWGDIVGGRQDAERFAASAPCLVEIKGAV